MTQVTKEGFMKQTERFYETNIQPVITKIKLIFCLGDMMLVLCVWMVTNRQNNDGGCLLLTNEMKWIQMKL